MNNKIMKKLNEDYKENYLKHKNEEKFNELKNKFINSKIKLYNNLKEINNYKEIVDLGNVNVIKKAIGIGYIFFILYITLHNIYLMHTAVPVIDDYFFQIFKWIGFFFLMYFVGMFFLMFVVVVLGIIPPIITLVVLMIIIYFYHDFGIFLVVFLTYFHLNFKNVPNIKEVNIILDEDILFKAKLEKLILINKNFNYKIVKDEITFDESICLYYKNILIYSENNVYNDNLEMLSLEEYKNKIIKELQEIKVI